eukprot:6097418-Lingulodinium_polyedra.AAC.1
MGRDVLLHFLSSMKWRLGMGDVQKAFCRQMWTKANDGFMVTHQQMQVSSLVCPTMSSSSLKGF